MACERLTRKLANQTYTRLCLLEPMACSDHIYYPVWFHSSRGSPSSAEHSLGSALASPEKEVHTACPQKNQGVPGKQKPRNPLLVSSGWIGGFRELSLLGRAPSRFPWVSYTAAVQHVSVSPSSRVTQPLRAVLSVSDYKLQYSSFFCSWNFFNSHSC